MEPARILVVDDEAAMLRSVERVLEDEYEVLGSTSPIAALVLAHDFAPHLAIVDVRMPDMDGFEVMSQLKAKDPHVQVILMTGSLFDVDEKLIRAIREKAFYFIHKPFDREVLRTLVQRCLELRFLEDANRRHMAHLENQLAEARAFQMSMLPPKDAKIDGFIICAEHRPCVELAGDLYDYAPAGDSRIALLVADVAGHGASAAMLTGIVKSAFQSSHVDHYNPEAVVRRVSEGLASFDAHRFVTLISARISPKEARLDYVNAGHEGGMILVPGKSSTLLEATGPIVSPAMARLGWKRETAEWTPETMVLLYTDGIPEAMTGDEIFGLERLRAIAERESTDLCRIPGAVLHEVGEFLLGRPAADDMTLLGVRCE